LAEENLADLPRAAEVERLAGQFMSLRFERSHALSEFTGQFRQAITVDEDAGALHVGDHRDERPVLRLVDGGHTLARKARLEVQPQAKRDISVFGGIAGRLVERDLVEGKLRLS